MTDKFSATLSSFSTDDESGGESGWRVEEHPPRSEQASTLQGHDPMEVVPTNRETVDGCETFKPRPLTEEERAGAWHAANFFSAESSQSSPIALWILGPSSVGKSTVVAKAAPDFGLCYSPINSTEEKEQRGHLDAVIIDGEFVRDAHGVWQAWVRTPDWHSAYPALKSTINREKDRLYAEAASQRKHLVIPHTMLNLQKGLTEMEELTRLGYTNHVLAVVAPLEECRKRGLPREQETGKRYQPLEFETSISAIPPIIAACNGQYKVARVVKVPDERALDFQVLAFGCGGQAEQLRGASTIFSEGELRSVIESATGKKSTSGQHCADTHRPTAD